jgi:hypothetical protein
MLAYCSPETNGAATGGATTGTFAGRAAAPGAVATGTGVAARVGLLVGVGVYVGIAVGVGVDVSVGAGVFVGSNLANFVGPRATNSTVGDIAADSVSSVVAKGL